MILLNVKTVDDQAYCAIIITRCCWCGCTCPVLWPEDVWLPWRRV